MTIREMQKILDAQFLYGEELEDVDAEFVFSADMMSDVLAYWSVPPRCWTLSVLSLSGEKCRTNTCLPLPWKKGSRSLQPNTICLRHAACFTNTDSEEVLRWAIS